MTDDNKLTEKSEELINELEGLFSVQAEKVNKETLGDSYDEMLTKYNLIFPKGKLPSKKPARSARGNIEGAFKWFFQNYKYSWETILKATENYIAEQDANNFKYCRTSQYFIRKQMSDKSWGSDLADFCELALSGDGDVAPDVFFETKVFNKHGK